MKLSGPGKDAQSALRDTLLTVPAPGAPLQTQQGVEKHPPSNVLASVCSPADAALANKVLETKQAQKAAFKVTVLLTAHLWVHYFLMQEALV